MDHGTDVTTESTPFFPEKGRIMGLDLGTRRIGLAISDVGRRIASPFALLERTRFAADAGVLEGYVRREDVGAMVIGLPLNMNGADGPRVHATRAFVRNLRERSDLFRILPVRMQDERLSTVAVERVLHDARLSRVRRTQVVDKMAAAYVLQCALDIWNGASCGRLPDDATTHAPATRERGRREGNRRR